MGIGTALYEELLLDNGKVLNPSFADYRVPSIKQMPTRKNVKFNIAAVPHQEGPYGAKGLGEGVTLSVAPAIASAIYDAIGVQMNDLPMTAESTLKIIKTRPSEETL